MGKIIEKTVHTKDGLKILLTTPIVGEGAGILSCVTDIIATSEHLLSTPEEFTYTANEEDAMIKSYLDHPDKVIITPKIDNKIIGMMDFRVGEKSRNRHQGEFGMSVHPNFQGRGIGKLMLNELINWVQANPQIETIRLRVFARNSRAISLYTNCGFVIEGREANGIKLADGIYDDVISMALDVR